MREYPASFAHVGDADALATGAESGEAFRPDATTGLQTQIGDLENGLDIDNVETDGRVVRDGAPDFSAAGERRGAAGDGVGAGAGAGGLDAVADGLGAGPSTEKPRLRLVTEPPHQCDTLVWRSGVVTGSALDSGDGGASHQSITPNRHIGVTPLVWEWRTEWKRPSEHVRAISKRLYVLQAGRWRAATKRDREAGLVSFPGPLNQIIRRFTPAEAARIERVGDDVIRGLIEAALNGRLKRRA